MCGISTVCELYGLTPRAVRFYEDRGLVQSGRDKFNCRKYDARARDRLGQIAAYRQAGLSIEDIQEIFGLENADDGAQRECATLKLHAKLVELEGARHQAERLIQHLSAERIVAVNGDERGWPRLALAR